MSGTLGTQTLYAGVYDFLGGAAPLTGALTLDAQNNPNARFVFQMGSTLTLHPGSSVNVINGGPGNEVYWVVGSSAALNTGTTLAGNILVDQSITMNTSADLYGRAIALHAAVTMDTNRIFNDYTAKDFGSYRFSGGTPVAVPLPGVLLFFVSGMGTVVAFGRRFFSVS